MVAITYIWYLLESWKYRDEFFHTWLVFHFSEPLLTQFLTQYGDEVWSCSHLLVHIYQTFPEVQCQHLAISSTVISSTSLSHKEHLALTGHKVASKYKWVDWWVENKRVLYVISWSKWQECLIIVNIIYLLHFLFKCVIFYFHLRSTCMWLYYAASTPFLYTKYKLWINKQNARQASSLKDSLDCNFRAPGHSTFWKRYKWSFPHANLQLVNSLWLSKQVRVWRTDSPSVWGWEDPEPAPVGVYYVSSGSQLALHAGAKPQFQIRDATETC